MQDDVHEIEQMEEIMCLRSMIDEQEELFEVPIVDCGEELFLEQDDEQLELLVPLR